MRGAKRKKRQEIAVGVVPRRGIGDLVLRNDDRFTAGHDFAGWLLRIVLEDPAQFIVGDIQSDVVRSCIEVEDSPALAAAVAAEHIPVQLDIQMGFFIVAERAAAVKLRTRVSHDMNAKQIHNVFNAAGQVAVDVQISSPSSCQAAVQLAFWVAAWTRSIAPAFNARFLPE